MTVVMYGSQQRGSKVKELMKVKVRKIDVNIRLIAFFLVREFDGFPFAFSPCRVQGKPKVACLCIVFFFLRTH